MKVKQISVFLENKKGRLLEAMEALGGAGINIRALSIADTAEFGILRLIVQEPDRARTVLEKADFTVKESEVIAVLVNDRPGGLAEVLRALRDADMNVEYIYAFVEKSAKHAVVVMRTENIPAGIKALHAAGISTLTAEQVCAL